MRKDYLACRRQLELCGQVSMATLFQGEGMGTHKLWGEETTQDVFAKAPHGSVVAFEGKEWLVEHLSAPPRLIVLGGGHISQPLVQLGSMLGFTVFVADDRPEFANKERFPEAAQVLCCPFEEVWERIPDLSSNYYVVVTRGHMGDEQCVREILRRKRRYVGMIGSKAKVKQTRENLLQAGFSLEEIDEIHAPIGLAIGAQTPEEIAVSIGAELIQVKNSRPAGSIPQEIWQALEEHQEPMVMVTIVKKSGSSPRGSGSRMLVDEKGIVAGTIGGGAVEHAAMQKGQQMLKDGISVHFEAYELNNIHSASLGMICGGRNEIFFETL